MRMIASYQPHVDRDLTLARAPANLTDFTGYVNAVGMFVRGGDVWIQRARCERHHFTITLILFPLK